MWAVGNLLIGGVTSLGSAGSATLELETGAEDFVVLSGHGAFVEGSGTVTIPEGTTFTTFAEHGSTISDQLGNAIETGREVTMSEFGHEVTGARSYLPGARVPNYTLHPPNGLNIMGSPVTVSQPTTLNTLLRANMGNVRWAACLQCIP
jgi:Putative adhesin Stv domain